MFDNDAVYMELHPTGVIALRHLMRYLCVVEHDTELLRAVAP